MKNIVTVYVKLFYSEKGFFGFIQYTLRHDIILVHIRLDGIEIEYW